MSAKRLTLLGVSLAFGLVALLWFGKKPDSAQRIILISVDTLRADHLGCYGYPRPTSPELDAIAAEGVVFEDVFSPSPWTLPAHGSLLTGLYPSRHGLKSHDDYLPSRIATLASALSRRGFRTAAVVNSHNLSARYGLDRGFQDFRYVEESVDRVEPQSEIIDQAIDWIRKAADRPFFLFVHSYDVHSDYRSKPEYERQFVGTYQGPVDGSTAQLIAARQGKLTLGARDAAHLVDLYDAGIRQMDEELSRLLSLLRSERRLEQTLLIITSDHGEEFLERGGVLHGRTQFQEVVRVPLILRGPGIPAARRIATPVSLVDVMPTVLALADLGRHEGLDGWDLRALWHNPDELGPRYIFGEADHNNVEPDITRAARRESFKLHFNRLTRERQLYDLGKDPSERRDVASQHSGLADQMLKEILRFMEIRIEGERPREMLTPEQIERLKSLGYLN
jgi:arylsulfatase A-like enzyme